MSLTANREFCLSKQGLFKRFDLMIENPAYKRKQIKLAAINLRHSLFGQRMISLEQHEKRVQGLNARNLALEAQLLDARKEVSSLQETVKQNEMTRKRNQQILKKIEVLRQQFIQLSKQLAEKQEEQDDTQQRQLERIAQQQLKKLQQAKGQSEKYNQLLERKRTRDEYNRKILEEMAELEQREGPQQFAKYHMVEAEALEELMDLRWEDYNQKKKIAELQKTLELKDQQINRLKMELEAAMGQIKYLELLNEHLRLLRQNQTLKNLFKRQRELLEQYQCTEKTIHKQGSNKDGTNVKGSNQVPRQL